MKNNNLDLLANFIYLSAIQTAGSMSSAARKLQMSQPALSIAMQKMEKAACVKLVGRHSHGISLTRAGVYLLEELSKINRQLDETRSKLKRIGGEENKEIRIGTKPVFLPTLWPNYFSLVGSKFPNVAITLSVHGLNAELERQLDSESIDAALIPLDSGKRRFLDYKVFDESFGLYRRVGITSVPRRIYGLVGALLGERITIDYFSKIAASHNLSITLLPDYASVRSLVELGQGFGLLSSSFGDSLRLENATHEFPTLSPFVRNMGFPVGFRTVEAVHGRHSNVVKLIRLLCRDAKENLR